MDGSKGGCCIARYGDGGGSSGSGGGDGRCSAFDKSKIDRIMLRYRPIAPKPMASGGGNSSPKEAEVKNSTVVAGNKSAKIGRGRRKYMNAATKGGANSGGSSNGSSRKRKFTGSPEGGSGRSSSSSVYGERLSRSSDGLSTTTTMIHEKQGNYYDDPPILPSPPTETRVVTLPLLPESPDLAVNKQKATDYDRRHNRNNPGPICLNFDYYNPTATSLPHKIITNPNNKIISINYGSPTVDSVVTVECITDAWIDDGGKEIGRLTDEERHMSLERDTCPGFISDGFHRVWWTNEAYKKKKKKMMMMMMMGSINNNMEEEEIEREQGGGVLVVMGEKVGRTIPLNYRAFTCRVKVQYHCSNGTGTTPCDAREENRAAMMNMNMNMMTTTTSFPCDVWRLEDGNGFAWRMDVEAALSLGRIVD